MSDTGLIILMFLSTLAGSAAGAWWNEKQVLDIKYFRNEYKRITIINSKKNFKYL